MVAGVWNSGGDYGGDVYSEGEGVTKLICSVDECGKPAKGGRGWCKPHYDAWVRKGDPLSYRGDRSHLSLWERIQEIGWTRTESGCYEYNGFRNWWGYGQFRLGRGRLERVHRVVYINLVGLLEPHEEVRHTCDNPPCGEPSHLVKGSHADNMRDMVTRQRFRSAKWIACPNGHPYPEDRPPSVDKNRCQQCARDRNRKYYQRKKENQYGIMASSQGLD